MNAPSIRFPNLFGGIEIYNLPKGITVPGIDFFIAFYGIIIGSAMLIGLYVAAREAKRTNQNPDLYVDFALYGIISAIVGARLYYVFFEWDYYGKHLSEVFNLRGGGLAIYGGVIGGAICLYIFSKIKKQSMLLMADTTVLGLVLGQAIGRWGNFFNREAFGGFSDGLLAMQIRVDEAAYTTQELLNKAVMVDGMQYIQVHPTFLYESLWNIGVFIILMIFRKHKHFDGEVFLLYLLCYGLGRSWIEGLRTDQLIMYGVALPVSQMLSMTLVIISAGIIIYKRFIKSKRG